MGLHSILNHLYLRSKFVKMAWWGCVCCLRLRHFRLCMGQEQKEETRIVFLCLFTRAARSGR